MWLTREALIELLREYGRHSEGCSRPHGDKYRCKCGWAEIEEQLVGPQ